jgi:hypothetical protein
MRDRKNQLNCKFKKFNHPSKQLDGQIWTGLIVGWPKIPGFGVRWSKPDFDKGWMVKIDFTQKKEGKSNFLLREKG